MDFSTIDFSTWVVPAAFIGGTIILVALVVTDLLPLWAAFRGWDSVAVRRISGRVMFFGACLVGVIVLGFMQSTALGAAQIGVGLVVAALIFILVPRITQRLAGTALGEALGAAALTLFGVGVSIFAATAKRLDNLLMGLALIGIGGWMLYSAIKKMSRGE